MASAVYSGRGLKRTLGADLTIGAGPAGLGMGGGVFWPRFTGPATRPVELSGPVPPVTPSLTPWTALAVEAMFWLVGAPEPRLIFVAPAPVLEAGIPAMPRLPRLMALAAG